jgi:putative phosphoesterase
MKILAFVDTHGSMSALKKIADTAKKEDVDYLVCAGDHTIFGDSHSHIIKKMDAIGKPVLIIHGNHESKADLKMLCDRSKNVKFMHKKTLEHGDYVFMAYGGGGFSSEDQDFEEWAKKTFESLKPGKKIILITHGPPYGTKLDLIIDEYAGCKSITEFVKKAKPVLLVCGHLHENRGVEEKMGNTLAVNPGPWGKVYTI